MKNTIDQDDLAPDLVKSQIVVDDEGAISECHELWIVRHATGERVGSECVQPGFDMVEDFSSGPWVLLCQIRDQFNSVLLGDGEQTDGILT